MDQNEQRDWQEEEFNRALMEEQDSDEWEREILKATRCEDKWEAEVFDTSVLTALDDYDTSEWLYN